MDYSSQHNQAGMPVSGFTLIELLVAIAILSILLGVGMPGLAALTDSSRLRSVTHNLTSAIQLARSEAVNRRTTTAVCQAGTNNQACNFAANWRDGWIVVAARQAGANLQAAAEVEVIRRWEAVNLRVGGVANGLVFAPTGRATVAGQLDSDNGSSTRCLFVNTSGRVSVVDDDDDPNDGCT